LIESTVIPSSEMAWLKKDTCFIHTRTCLTWLIIYGLEASTILDGDVLRVLLHP
jgi:hypothetical protein